MRIFAGDVAGESNELAEALGQRFSDGLQRELRVDLALRAAEVGHGDHLGAAVKQRLQGGKGRVDAARVSNVAVLVERDVEVGADQNVAAFHAFVEKLLERLRCHCCLLEYVVFIKGSLGC